MSRRQRQPGTRQLKRLGWLSLGAGLGQFLGLALQGFGCAFGQPAMAADRIVVSYGFVERSLQVHDLEVFAETGQLSRQLTVYAQMLNLSPAQLAQFRQSLTARADFDVVAVSQFLYTPQGKFLLKQASQVIQTPSRHAGFSATRGALILAAADPNGGLSILNFLKYFPSEAIRVDAARGIALADLLNQTLGQSGRAIDAIEAQSTAAAQTTPEVASAIEAARSQLRAQQVYDVDVSSLPVPGLEVAPLLYLPIPKPQSKVSPFGRPVVIISHGLGSDRNTFDYLARYLAGAGIAVVSVEHSGSNTQQLFALLEGRANAVTPAEEFVNRPRDISHTLDTLAQRARQSLRLSRQLDLSRVGVIGQSFGGYTALALAGASFNPTYLAQQCSPSDLNLNLSLLLQCEATQLPSLGNSLADPRIRAVFVMNPIGSALFGPSGFANIKVPIMIVSGARDTVAPAFSEQIAPFNWLTEPDRYLLLIGNGTHFSVIGGEQGGQGAIPVPPELIGPRPDIAQEYMKVLSLAFFNVYLRDQDQFQLLLQPAFVQNNLGTDPLPLSLTQNPPTLPTGALPTGEPVAAR